MVRILFIFAYIKLTVILSSTGFAVAQKLEEKPSEGSTSGTISATHKSSAVIGFLKGRTTEDGVYYFPFGWHTNDAPTLGNIMNNNVIALSKGPIVGGTFINSYKDRTFFLGAIRTVYTRGRIGLDYSAGLMVGYKGKLSSDTDGGLRNALFEGNVNPYMMLTPYYKLTDNLDIRLLVVPHVILIGLKRQF